MDSPMPDWQTHGFQQRTTRCQIGVSRKLAGAVPFWRFLKSGFVGMLALCYLAASDFRDNRRAA